MKPLLFLLAVAPLAAESLVHNDLAGVWRLSDRDDPSFAAPGIDDRAWTPFPLPRQRVLPIGTYWLRRQIDIPAGIATDDLLLTLGPVSEVYEVFLNGQRIAARGEQKMSQSFVARPESFPVPRGIARSGERLTLALRVWRPAFTTNTYSVGRLNPDQGPYLLTSAVLRPIGPAAIGLQTRERIAVTSLLFGAGNLLIAFWLLAAWLTERDRSELLMVIGYLSTMAVTQLTEYFSYALDGPATMVVLTGPMRTVRVVFLALLAVQIAGQRSRWWRIAVWVPALIHIAWNVRIWVDDQAAGGYPVFVWTWLASCILLTITTLGILIYGWRRVSWDNGTKVLAVTLAFLIIDLTPGFGTGHLRVIWSSHGFVWTSGNVSNFVLMVVISFLLMRRLEADRIRKVRLEEELAAARLVQETLLATSTPGTRCFEVDAAYLPASEVGGDFYFALPAGPDGSLMVVLGDVSGKGLRAALLVAHLSGAVSNERSRQPAEMLGHFNESLLGRTRGGFVTCCCVLLQPDGRLQIASAGHPAPWIDGVEAAVESGLPLGVAADACYATCVLPAGRQITLVSDGVVEAANANGALFGFERTGEISTRPAQEIAEAARAWGQNDDITVVTVRRVG